MVDRLSRSLSLPRVQAAFLVSFGSLTLFVLRFSVVYGSSERTDGRGVCVCWESLEERDCDEGCFNKVELIINKQQPRMRNI